jgi:acrylyl-CoA reductase (NADPH)
MKKNQFKALVVKKDANNSFIRNIEYRYIAELPKGEVLINVIYSSLNYKDGLSCIGNLGVTRRYPHTPGIDAAGYVVSSESDKFKKGDEVIVISHDLGMNTSGGFSQYIRVPASWPMHLPKGLSLRESMIFGTAGFTAALAVDTILKNYDSNFNNKILVSGVSGGVGSISAAILIKLGFLVVGSTGKKTTNNFLFDVGVNKFIDRVFLSEEDNRPLLKIQWDAAIDTVGGNTLSNLIKSVKDNGLVISTGMVSSEKINLSIMPFILRGVKLFGINSQGTDTNTRHYIWNKLSHDWKPENLESIVTECNLENLNSQIDSILNGLVQGRVIINLT